MAEAMIQWPKEKPRMYRMLAAQAASLTEATPLPLPALCNLSALLWDALPEINWAGFYLMKDGGLVLGPFQGKTACILIPLGKGVCGTAAASRSLQLVPDVHAFPGHIACDSASNAEIVVPLVKDGMLLGVLDIDSPTLNRFDAEDAAGLTELCRVLLEKTDWTHGIL